MDIRDSDYAGFLEDICGVVMEHQPDKIAVCTMNPDGTMVTGYYGYCDQQDKALMAHQIYSDSIIDVVLANAKMIVEAAEEDDEDEEE